MKPRVRTIVWGFLLLGIATLFLVGTLADLSRIASGVVIAGTIAVLGALLVIGGLLGALVGSIRSAKQSPSDPAD